MKRTAQASVVEEVSPPARNRSNRMFARLVRPTSPKKLDFSSFVWLLSINAWSLVNTHNVPTMSIKSLGASISMVFS